MNNIAHIFHDEKFIDTAIDTFEELSNIHNIYLCYTPQKELKYIQKTEYIRLYSRRQNIIDYINQSDIKLVILHCLIFPFRYLNRINPSIKIIWLSWGSDIYCSFIHSQMMQAPIKLPLYKPLTLNYLKNKEIISLPFIKEIIKTFLYQITKEQKRFYQRVDFLSTVLPLEYDLIKKNPLFNNTQYFYFSYIRNQAIEKRVPNGKNILLGNSGNPTNNHLDILNILKDLPLKDRKIIIPLSYAAKPQYIAKIKQFISQHKMEKQVVYLEKFINYSDYRSLIQSCDTAIFGHIRQQALGNIIEMLENGSKIYLHMESIAYQQLNKDGYKIFSIAQLNNNTINIPLNEKEIEHNIQILKAQENFPKLIIKLQEELNSIFLK